jgi:hypothetical protein
MISNKRIYPLLFSSIPLFFRHEKNEEEQFYSAHWTDYSKCSQEKLKSAIKISSAEYVKLKKYCEDSLSIFKKDYEQIISTQVEREMELTCKQGSRLSITPYEKKYPPFRQLVKDVFCRVAEKNVKYCDLSELTKISDRLTYLKINQLLSDALLENDPFTAIDLINNHIDKLNLVTLSRNLTNPYIIDYLIKKILSLSKSSVTYKIGGDNVFRVAPRGDSSNNSYEAIGLLFFLSIAFGNEILTKCLVDNSRLQSFFTENYFTRHCQGFMRMSYFRDDYHTFEKYCNELCKLPNYKIYFEKLLTFNVDYFRSCAPSVLTYWNQSLNVQSIGQKNDLLQLIQIHAELLDRPNHIYLPQSF